MGAVPGRRSVSAPLRSIIVERADLGAAAARRSRRVPRNAGVAIVIGLFERLARPLLHALEPEDAHGLAVRMLKFAPLPPASRDDKRLAMRAFGLNFPN